MLYRDFRAGMESAPGPEDPTFETVYALFLDITSLASVRLIDPEMGENLAGAARVLLLVEWAEATGAVCRGMPIRVPSLSVRTLKALGRYLEQTPEIMEVGAYLQLVSPIFADLAGYAERHLGRLALPVRDEFALASRLAALVNESVRRTVPGIEQ